MIRLRQRDFTIRQLASSRPLFVAMLVALLFLGSATASLAQKTRYDPANDYRYDLSQAASVRIAPQWSRESGRTAEWQRDAALEWPQWPSKTTVLLELEVKAGTGGARIVTRAGSVSSVQYFEPGARGVRYLDLTAFQALAAGTRLELRARKMRFETAGAQLYGFDNLDLESQRVLVLAPHPDDAEIAAFGLYSSTKSDVVTVTAGDAGGFNYRDLFEEPGEHYREKGRIRVWDSITVPFLGGVPPGRARNLGYYDATLQRLYERPGEAARPPLAEIPSPGWYRSLNVDSRLAARPFEGTWQALVSDIEAEILEVEPTLVAAPHPRLDGHWDHQFTTIALIEALERLARDDRLPAAAPPMLYLYTNHPSEEEGFPFGPREGMPSLPPWLEAPLRFSAVHSLLLDEHTRDLKLLALEMMHDLRPLDLHPPVRPRTHLARYFKALAKSFERKPADYRYFRRAARPAEVFFVLDLSQASELKTSFLATFERQFQDDDH